MPGQNWPTAPTHSNTAEAASSSRADLRTPLLYKRSMESRGEQLDPAEVQLVEVKEEQLVEVKEEQLEEPLDPPASSHQAAAAQPGCSQAAGVHIKIEPIPVWLHGVLLRPVGVLYAGQALYRVGDPCPPTTNCATDLTRPSQSGSSQSRSSQSRSSQRGSSPDIKKPPDAFLLFLQEHRQSVVAECDVRSNAGVNAIPGEQKNSVLVWTPLESPNPEPKRLIERKREPVDEQRDEKPRVKKPPNAFMLFMMEQRASVVAESNIRNNAAVNTILGTRWNSMTPAEQEPYFKQALAERKLHEQQHPDWSSKDNYGKKKRREIPVLQKPRCIAMSSPPLMECPEAGQ